MLKLETSASIQMLIYSAMLQATQRSLNFYYFDYTFGAPLTSIEPDWTLLFISNKRTQGNFKCYAFSSGVFNVKVDRRPCKENEIIICFWKPVKYKHTAFVPWSTEKISVLVTNLRFPSSSRLKS